MEAFSIKRERKAHKAPYQIRHEKLRSHFSVNVCLLGLAVYCMTVRIGEWFVLQWPPTTTRHRRWLVPNGARTFGLALAPVQTSAPAPPALPPVQAGAPISPSACSCLPTHHALVAASSLNCHGEIEGREGRWGREERRGAWRAARGRHEVGAEAQWQTAVRRPPAPLQHVQRLIYFENVQIKHL
jgi:hypothetical protein